MHDLVVLRLHLGHGHLPPGRGRRFEHHARTGARLAQRREGPWQACVASEQRS
jgi:hypothetical protein